MQIYHRLKDIEAVLVKQGFEQVWDNSFRLSDLKYGKESIFFNKNMGLIAHIFSKKVDPDDKHYFRYGSIYGEGVVKGDNKIPATLACILEVLDECNKNPSSDEACTEHFKLKIDTMFSLKTSVKQLKEYYELNKTWKTPLPYELFDLVSDKESQYDGWEFRAGEIAKEKLAQCPIELRKMIGIED